jgi:ActR/RegA family two-component response regulator
MLAKRVLVVEDDALVSMAVEAEIAGCDHAVVGPFGSGADALASLGFVEPPDAAVIDLRLRDGSCLDCARSAGAVFPSWSTRAASPRWSCPPIFEPRLGSRSRP